MNKIIEMHEMSTGIGGMAGATIPKGYLPATGLTPKYYVEGTGYYNNYNDAISGAEGFDDTSMVYENPTAGSTDADWGSMKGAGGVALGAANFGLGLAGFLDQKKTAKLQRGLMQQQLASNEETMANKRADRAHIKSVFGGGTATSGLKAV